MASYLTPSGLLVPNLQQILTQMENINWLTFGAGFNQLPSSVAGQWNAVYANASAQIWQDVSNVWTNWNPAMAGGVSLDNVVSVNGIRRLPATFGTGFLTLYGTLGTVIPAFGMTASVAGDPTTEFQNTVGGTIGAGTNAVQTIVFSANPDSGQFTLVWNGFQTSVLNFDAPANTGPGNIQSALNALTGLTGAVVTGSIATGLTVTYTGANGSQPVPILAVGTNTLAIGVTPVGITITQTVIGVFPNVTLPIQCLTAGEIPAYAGTITVIVTPIVGVNTVSNLEDITPGNNIESDPTLRARRYVSVAFPGSTNADAIRSKVANITGVTNVFVDNNVTLVTNANGTPGKAFQVVVLGGANQAIADTIFGAMPAGIQAYGTTNVTIIDASGNPQNIGFTRPTAIPIYVIARLTSLPDYPVGANLVGTIAITVGTPSVVGTGTAFLTTLRVGQSIRVSDNFNSEFMTVMDIVDDTHLTVRSNATHTYTAGIVTPQSGDVMLQQQIVTYMSQNFSVGQDVIAWRLALAAEGIPGIDNLRFTLGTAPNPALNVDIPIAATEISAWDTGEDLSGNPFIVVIHD